MSYTIWVTVNDIEDVFYRNYTSNVSWMWTECLALPPKLRYRDGTPVMASRLNRDIGEWEKFHSFDEGLRLLEGSPCSEAAGILSRAVERMKTKADEYRMKEPENGWGNYDGALNFLSTLAETCSKYPTGYIGMSS